MKYGYRWCEDCHTTHRHGCPAKSEPKLLGFSTSELKRIHRLDIDKSLNNVDWKSLR